MSLRHFVSAMLVGIAIALLAVSGSAQTVRYYQTGEEFTGPFPSWKNVKTDFGAKGDGVTNDAPAISKALTSMKTNVNPWCVLFFPAGTYLIKSTIINLDRHDQDNMGMTITGEDPATTRIVCSKNFTSSALGQGAMLRLDGTYGNISRLTLDGKGIAKFGLLRDGSYGTDWRVTDLWCKDIAGVGIQWGGMTDLGEDLSVMTRCRFSHCQAGIGATNQNAIGPYVWYSLFEDCAVGVDNGVGFVHAIGNVFLRSTVCDIDNGYIGYMILNNTSIGSKQFLGTIEDKTVCMANGNKIYNTIDPVSLLGVDVMLDNVIRSRTAVGPALLTTRQNTLAVGNTFTVKSPVQPIYDPTKAIDGNPTTGCFDPNALKVTALPNGGGDFRLTWQSTIGKVVTSYALTNGDKPASDPKDFKLLASNDGAAWMTLDTRTNESWTARRQRHAYTLTNTAAYTYYRLSVTANQTTPINKWGDQKGGAAVNEWELLDARGQNITADKSGQISGRLTEFASGYTGLQEHIVSPATLQVPRVVTLPGTPANHHRKIFEVRLGTGDDAKELQAQIDAAAKEPAGSNPVVHLPKGNYQLKSTITVPANTEMQIIGDGGRGCIFISWIGQGTGPLFTLQGPSRITMRDFVLAGGTADAIHMDNCDQAGGRIYCDQVDCFGNTPETASACNFYIDGVEQSDVTVLDQYIGGSNRSIVVKGGPVLAAGGKTDGQISFLMGYVWGRVTPTQLDVQRGGKLLFAGYRTENRQAGLMVLNGDSSGKLTFACNNDAMDSYVNTPFIINGFKGMLCSVANSMWGGEVKKPLFDISGDGSRCKVLSMCDYLSGGVDPNTGYQTIWKDTSAPAAQAALNTSEGIYTDWRWQRIPNVYRQTVNAKPEASLILESLQQLRAMRIEPPTNRKAGVTDIKMIRVPIDVGKGQNGIVMSAKTK